MIDDPDDGLGTRATGFTLTRAALGMAIIFGAMEPPRVQPDFDMDRHDRRAAARNRSITRRQVADMFDDARSAYRYSITSGKQITLEKAYHHLIRAGAVRIVRRRFKPPVVIVIRPRRW